MAKRTGGGEIGGVPTISGAPPRLTTATPWFAVALLSFALASVVFAFAASRDASSRAPGQDGAQVLAALAGPNTVIIPQVQKQEPTPEPTGTATPTPTATPAPRPASAAGLKVWSNGDSTSYFMTVALLSMAQAQGGVPVHEADYVISSGLVSGDYDWPSRLSSDMAMLDPDIVVFMVGANDAVVRPDLSSYATVVGDTMDLLYRPGRTVAWVGQPAMDPAIRPELNEAIPGLNAVYAAEAAKRPWVVYVDGWAATTDADGAYAMYLPDEHGIEQQVRAGDGVHLTSEGGRRLALAVMAALFSP